MNEEIKTNEERYSVSIAMWSDGTWCYPGDIMDYMHKSDDYIIAHVFILNEDDIEDAVQQYLQS